MSNTNRGNLTTVRVYDALNDRFLESQTHFDTLGNPVKQVDVLNRETLIGYSSSHHFAYPTQVTNPLGHTAQTGYNFNTGLPASWTDANGQVTTQTYEAYNRPLKRTFPDGGWMDWAYWDEFNSGQYRTRVRTRRLLAGTQKRIRNEYFDGLGRLLRTLNYEGNSVHIYVLREYALCGCSGRTSKVSMPYRPGDPIYWTATEYDGLGRVRKVIPPDGSSSLNFTEHRYGFTTEMSAPRRQVRATFDAKGVGMLHLYDADGVLRRVGEDASYATLSSNTWTDYDAYPGSLRQKSAQWEGQSLTFNFAKHMFRQTVQGAQVRTFQHDALGRLVWEEHPEFYHQGVQYGVSHLYDDAGRMIQRTDPRGIVSTMAYDGLNRPLSVTYSDSTPAASYAYDQGLYGIGRLSSASNSAASSSYTYDRMGRVLQQYKTIGGNAFSMSWAYNKGGLVTSYTLPNGTAISQTHDNLGRPTSITSDWVDASHPATLASSFVYHPTGALTSVDYGNGTTSTRSYTSGGLLKTLQHGTPSDPGGLLDFEYDYQEGISNNGRIMGITDHKDPSKSQIYSYDGFQRLQTAETQGSHWGLSWSYDRYGNRLSQTVTKGTAPSQGLGVDARSNRATGWAYDKAGNALNDGRHSYAFDANNRITGLDGGSTLYKYNSGGTRVQKVTGSQTTSYFFDVAEYVSGLGWSRLYIKLGNEKLAEYSGDTTRFFHADHRFTPRVRTDLYGTPDQTWDDLPFGDSWQSTGGGSDQHRLTGHMRDDESEKDYAGARLYSNTSARWLSVDPVLGVSRLPQSFNRFGYVLNDPVNLIDPDGREWKATCRSRELWPYEGIIWGIYCTVYWEERHRQEGRRGGSGGQGPGRGATASPHEFFADQARMLLEGERIALVQNLKMNGKDNGHCKTIFESFEVDFDDFIEKLEAVSFVDGTTSDDLIADLVPEDMQPSNPEERVRDFFSEVPVALFSPPLNNSIYFRPGSVFRIGSNGILRLQLLLGHETFHKFGITDTRINNFLFGSFALHFTEHCIKGNPL